MKLRHDFGVALAALSFVATVLYLWPGIVSCCMEVVR